MNHRYKFESVVFLVLAFLNVAACAVQWTTYRGMVCDIGDRSWKLSYELGATAEWRDHVPDLWFGTSVASNDREGLQDVRLAIENRTDDVMQVYGFTEFRVHLKDSERHNLVQTVCVDPIQQMTSFPGQTRVYLILPPHSTSVLGFDLFDGSLHWTKSYDAPLVFPFGDPEEYDVWFVGAWTWLSPYQSLSTNLPIGALVQKQSE